MENVLEKKRMKGTGQIDYLPRSLVAALENVCHDMGWVPCALEWELAGELK